MGTASRGTHRDAESGSQSSCKGRLGRRATPAWWELLIAAIPWRLANLVESTHTRDKQAASDPGRTQSASGLHCGINIATAAFKSAWALWPWTTKGAPRQRLPITQHLGKLQEPTCPYADVVCQCQSTVVRKALWGSTWALLHSPADKMGSGSHH